jgi:hypothetical protein
MVGCAATTDPLEPTTDMVVSHAELFTVSLIASSGTTDAVEPQQRMPGRRDERRQAREQFTVNPSATIDVLRSFTVTLSRG